MAGTLQVHTDARPASSPPQLPTTSTLRRVGEVLALVSAYDAGLRRIVFPAVTVQDAKLARSYRRTLLGFDGFQVLSIVWKESDLVPEHLLASAGMTRNFTDGVTRHSLARLLTTSVAEHDLMNKRVRSIIEAAETYLLVEMQATSPNRHPICCTDLLHQVMCGASMPITCEMPTPNAIADVRDADPC